MGMTILLREDNSFRRYKDQFGFVLPDRAIIIDDIRIRALAKSAMNIDRAIATRPENTQLKETKVTARTPHSHLQPIFFRQ